MGNNTSATITSVSNFSKTNLATFTDSSMLTDRIINIKLYRCSLDENGVPSNTVSNDFVTLRSDYEVRESGSYAWFITCPQKPSISIKYTVFSGNSAPMLTLTIDNFNPYTADGTSSGLAFSDNPFRAVEIHMGYMKQFKDWSGVTYSSSAYKSFLNLAGDSESVTVLRGTILDVQQTKYPPDSQTVFEICPATVTCGVPDVRNYLPDNAKLRQTTMVSELYNALEAYKSVYIKDLPWSLSDFQNASTAATFSEVLFYWLISRRYWDSYVSSAENADITNSNLSAYKSKNTDNAVTFNSNMESLRTTLESSSSTVDSLAFLPDKPAYLQRVVVGTQSLKYDIPVYLATLLKEEAAEDISEDQIKLELASYVKLYAENPEKMLSTIKAQVYPYLGWTTGLTKYKNAGKNITEMAAGGTVSVQKAYTCLCVYDQRRSDDSQSVKNMMVSGSTKVLTLDSMKTYAWSFPAIYDIMYSAITTAHTPFFGMFPIMYPVKFEGSYILTDFVQYYIAPKQGFTYFSCFSMSVEFATVEDRNECELKMTELKEVTNAG